MLMKVKCEQAFVSRCCKHDVPLFVPVLSCTEDKLVLSGGRLGRYNQTPKLLWL